VIGNLHLIIIIQLNYLLFCTKSTATRPVTDTAQCSAVIGNYIMDIHNIKSRIHYRNTIMQEKTNGDDK
jgi:Na+/H+ antiporter NhaC